MSKELYIAAHEDLVDEMMERTGCSWEEAYEATGDGAYTLMQDRFADMIDRAMDSAREQGK